MKYISLLGATGSIGTQTLEVIRQHPNEFKLVAISFGENIDKGLEIIHEFQPQLVSVKHAQIRDRIKHECPPQTKLVYGQEGLVEVATYEKADYLLNAVLGRVGLEPTIEAIKSKKTIALANKETLVTAGHLVMGLAKENRVDILPVDSEHSAIFQSLKNEAHKEIDRLILTASGGSFRDKRRDELQGVTVMDALKHPNWSMGAKITIDSATMMNKGLEVIEARWLFDVPYEKIDVVIHKESIVHSLVEYIDKSVIAELGHPDMKGPIQYALSYPNRLELNHAKRLNLWEIGELHFQKVDFERFRCLDLAYHAGKVGGTMPTVLNAANEIAVQAFLDNRISFLDIETIVERALTEHHAIQTPDLDTIQQVDTETRAKVETFIQ